MCRKLVVTNEIFLGTRAICYARSDILSLDFKSCPRALPFDCSERTDSGRDGITFHS